MMANEAEANFDELDDHEEDDDSSGLEEDEKVRPWSAITDDGKTTDGQPSVTMKKAEDEVLMVAFDYNVMTYRKYGDDLMRLTSNSSDLNNEEGQEPNSARNLLINNSFEEGEN